MDKTVRLWHLDSKSCLKTFSHSDYGKYFGYGTLSLHVSINLSAKLTIVLLDEQCLYCFSVFTFLPIINWLIPYLFEFSSTQLLASSLIPSMIDTSSADH